MIFDCNVVLLDSRLRSQFTQSLLYTVVPDHLGKGALALTKRDCYPSSRSQLCSLCRALRDVLSGLVLLSSCRHIMPRLMRSRVMTWLVRLAMHTTVIFTNLLFKIVYGLLFKIVLTFSKMMQQFIN